MNNPNHPKKGSRTKVDPIRNTKDIKAIIKLLSDEPRNQLLFIMGINNGLRAGDLLQLKAEDVCYLKTGEYLTIRESKTKKENILVVNKPVFKAIKYFLETVQPNDDDYLFVSRKGNNKPLTIQAVNNLVKKWAGAINLRGNYGAHSLRMTWGFQQRIQFGVGIEIIAKRFNHSNPAITMRYLGIHDKEVHHTLMNEIG